MSSQITCTNNPQRPGQCCDSPPDMAQRLHTSPVKVVVVEMVMVVVAMEVEEVLMVVEVVTEVMVLRG